MYNKLFGRRRRLILTTATALVVVFIFANSLRTGDASSEQSQGVLAWIQQEFPLLSINEHFVRKAAHFLEFSFFGGLLFATISTYTCKMGARVWRQLYIGLLVPLCDETLQLFSSGRSSQISDVWLDYAGVWFGMGIILLIQQLVLFKKKRSA